MKTTHFAIAAAAATALAFAIACGPPPHDRALDIVATNPTGQFDGVPWAMTKATVKRSGPDGGTLDIKMFGDAVADCASSSRDAGYIMFSMPAQVGKRTLQLSLSDLTSTSNQTITFFTPPSNNNISVDGILNLTDVGATSMTLGVLAKAGKSTDVNGTFTATYCP